MGYLAATIGVLTVLFIVLYWKAVGESNRLTNFVLMILIDETVYAAQRKGLIGLVQSIDAKNAGDLGGKVNLAVIQLAEKLRGTSLGVSKLLWELKTAPTPPTR